jgi:hypothetical protein
MTLIAAFRTLDVPVLVGDFLITDREQPLALRRKLRRINPQLVVAWTGSLFTAEAVLTHLDEALGDRAPTREDLEAALADAADKLAERQAKVKLIGWAACPDPDGFGWESDNPGAVHWGDYTRHDGAGHAEIAKHAADGVRSGGGDPVDHVVTAISFLLADEWGAQRNQADGFGFGYEATYWDGAEFQYINNVLYVPWTTWFDVDGKLASSSVGTLHRTALEGEHSTVEIIDHRTGEIRGHIIEPVGAFDPARTQAVLDRLPREGPLDLSWDRCGLVVTLRADDYVGPEFMVAGNAKFKRLFELLPNGTLRIGLDPVLLEQMYAKVREHERELGGEKHPRFRAFFEPRAD